MKIDRISSCQNCGWCREVPLIHSIFCYKIGSVKGEIKDCTKILSDCPLEEF